MTTAPGRTKPKTRPIPPRRKLPPHSALPGLKRPTEHWLRIQAQGHETRIKQLERQFTELLAGELKEFQPVKDEKPSGVDRCVEVLRRPTTEERLQADLARVTAERDTYKAELTKAQSANTSKHDELRKQVETLRGWLDDASRERDIYKSTCTDLEQWLRCATQERDALKAELNTASERTERMLYGVTMERDLLMVERAKFLALLEAAREFTRRLSDTMEPLDEGITFENRTANRARGEALKAVWWDSRALREALEKLEGTE